jgi:hypothetical protein
MRLADQILHRDEVLAVRLAEVEDATDVGVGDPRSDARLVEKHLHVVFLVREMRMDALECDQLLKTRGSLGPRQIHARHASRRQLEAQLIAADLLRRGTRRDVRISRGPPTAVGAYGFHVFGVRILHQDFRSGRDRPS